MAIDNAPTGNVDLKAQVYQAVAQQKISSLDKIAQIVGSSEDLTREAIVDLMAEGSLQGSMTEDGRRFFLSNVKVSDAPVAIKHEEYKIAEPDTRLGKTVFAGGIATMIAGFVLRGLLTINPVLEHVGAGVLLIGMVILVAGWLHVSRSIPPEDLRKA